MNEKGASDSKLAEGVRAVLALLVAQLPQVPADAEAVRQQAATTTRRIADASRTDAIEGLHEIHARAQQHPGELGDLAPDAEECEATANAMEAIDLVIERLYALTAHAEARRMVLDDTACHLLGDAHELVAQRIERGRIPAESYRHVRRFVGWRSQVVTQGIARAQRARASMNNAAPANETTVAKKTG